MMATKIKNASRRDVAKAAGVSLTTVTHALNPAPGVRVNPDTRAKVKKIAKELGYRPNFIGRALVTGKTYSIGLLEPHYESMFRDYYQRIIYGMVPVLGKDDYNLMLLFRDPPENCRRTLRQGRVDGMIILQSDFDSQGITEVLERNIPSVVLNTTFDCNKYKQACNVVSDHYDVVSQVVDKLVNRGCRNLVSFTAPGDCEPNKQLFDAFNYYTDKLVNKGIAATSIVPSKSNFQAQLQNLFKSGIKWDGFYLDGERHLTTLLKETANAGMQLGKDFKLCLTDATTANDAVPFQSDGITIYIQQPEILGETAWRQMKKLIAGKNTEKCVKVPYIEL
jgi:DNA-binding LacI/PurR family transcriptional regulator